jgi:hypothetical protein
VTLAASAVALGAGVPAALATATHDEWVAQINPICKDASGQLRRIQAKAKPTGNRYNDFLLATKRFGKLLGRTTKRIAAVQPAPGEEAVVASWIEGLRRQKRLIDRFLRAVGHGKARTANRITKRLVRVERRNRQQAANLGLVACTRRSDPQ